MRIVKLLLGFVLVLLVLVVGAVLAITFLIDPNDYKPQLVKLVENSTGRQLKIPGRLKITWYPWLGVSGGQVQLANAPGFDEPDIMSIKKFSVRVKLQSLLQKRIEVDSIHLDNPHIRLVTRADGSSNWEGLIDDKDQRADNTHKGAPQALGALVIKGIFVRDGQLTFRDETQKATAHLKWLNIATGSVKPDTDIPVSLAFHITSNLLPEAMDFNFKTSLKFDSGLSMVNLGSTRFDLKSDNTSYSLAAERGSFQPVQQRFVADNLSAELNQGAVPLQFNSPTMSFDIPGELIDFPTLEMQQGEMRTTGSVNIRGFKIPNISFDLNMDSLQIHSPDNAEGNIPGSDSGTDETLIPVGLLGQFNAQGDLSINRLQLEGLEVSNIHISVMSQNKIAELSSVTANLSGGTFVASSTLDTSQPVPTIRLTAKVDQVQIDQFLSGLEITDQLEGKGNIDLDLITRGNSTEQLGNQLNGELRVVLNDGAVKGIDIQKILLELKDLAGNSGELSADNAPAEKTRFAELSADFSVDNSIFVTQNIDHKAPAFRITGRGKLDLPESSINYRTSISVVDSIEGQGGAALEDLRGVTIPMKIHGPLHSPSYALDVTTLLKSELKRELEKKYLDDAQSNEDASGQPLSRKQKREQRKKKLKNELLKSLFD